MTPEPSSSNVKHVYRLNNAERACIPFFAVIMVAVGASWLFGGVNVGTRVIGALVVLMSVVAAAWLMFYIRLVLATDTLIIRNVRTRSIAYADIEQVQPEYEGLVVRTGERKFVALAIQRWNISLILRRRTRADLITDEIRRRVEYARTDPH